MKSFYNFTRPNFSSHNPSPYHYNLMDYYVWGVAEKDSTALPETLRRYSRIFPGIQWRTQARFWSHLKAIVLVDESDYD